MSTIIIFGLGMVVMLLICLLIIGGIVMVRLSKQTRLTKETLTTVTDSELPEIIKMIQDGDNDVFRAIEDEKRDIEKKIDSRIDKLKSDLENKLKIK